MACDSTTRCGSANNTFGGFEGETGVVIMATPEKLGLESPADGWEDCEGLYCASLPFSCKMCFLDFAPVEVVPKWSNGREFGGSTT